MLAPSTGYRVLCTPDTPPETVRGTTMTHPDDRDEKLAGLLAELTEQEQRGEAAQVERLAAEHPDLGIELRQLWAAAQLAQVFGRPRPAPRQELPATRAERADP